MEAEHRHEHHMAFSIESIKPETSWALQSWRLQRATCFFCPPWMVQVLVPRSSPASVSKRKSALSDSYVRGLWRLGRHGFIWSHYEEQLRRGAPRLQSFGGAECVEAVHQCGIWIAAVGRSESLPMLSLNALSKPGRNPFVQGGQGSFCSRRFHSSLRLVRCPAPQRSRSGASWSRR